MFHQKNKQFLAVLCLLICVIVLYAACTHIRIDAPTSKLPDLPLLIEIERVKVVHYRHPKQGNYQYVPKITSIDCPPPTYLFGGVFIQVALSNPSETNTITICADSFYIYKNNELWRETGGWNILNYLQNTVHDCLQLAPKATIIKNIHVIPSSNKRIVSDSADIFYDFEEFKSFETGEDMLVYRYEDRIIKNFLRPKIPIETWYARDFKTYEEAKAYGYPFLVDNRQDTTLKYVVRELEMYHPK
jgi:hypothetical protein